MPAQTSVVSGIAGRYATALFELAREAGALDTVAADLRDLRQMLDESADLTRLVRSPMFGRDAQWKALQAVLQQAGTGDVVRRFVGVVAKNRRLFALADMATAYQALLSQHRGEVVAQVTTAHPLSDRQVASLTAELGAAMKTDVNLEQRVDAGVLGGMIVRVGSRMVDSSLRTKLQSLKIAMKEVG